MAELQNTFLIDRDYLKSIIDEINKVQDENEKEVLRKKSLFLSIKIRRGQLEFPSSESQNLFSEIETQQLLKKLTVTTTNRKLKLRYYYLLWNSPQKHNGQLDEIFNISLVTINNNAFLYENFDNYLLLENFVCLFYKNKAYSKVCYEQTNKFLCLKEKDIAYYKYHLLWLITKLKKYDLEKLQNLESCIDSIFDHFIEKRDSLQADSLHKLSIILSQKMAIETSKWHVRTGEIYEKHADYRLSDPQPLVSYKSLIRAKEYYQDAKQRSKVERVELKIKEVKKRKLLSRVPGLGLPHDILDSLYLGSINKANATLEFGSEEIFCELLNLREELVSSQYNPKKSVLQELNVFDVFEFDNNRNIYDRDSTKNLEFDGISLLKYRQYLEVVIYTFMNKVIIDAYLRKKFDSSEFINFLSNSTWFSTTMKYYTSEGQEIKFNWMELIRPSIELLFEILHSTMTGDNESQSKLILIIDSLSVKFEGLFRQILHYNNLPTTKRVRKESQEMTLEDFINDEYICKTFHKNELTFLKYLLTRQGLNLRNNISHTYFKTNRDYHWRQLLYILLGLLIVGDKNKIDKT